MRLQKTIRDFCLDHGWEKTYWIAYSGGLDSHVLLTAIHALTHEFPLNLRVIHINHGLSPNAASWSTHCQEVCQHLNLDYHQHDLSLHPEQGESLEACAREARYAAMKNLIANDDILVTAHHQDDQAETVLLQLLRGAGLKGLSAMPSIKPFGLGFHARPFLGLTRDILQTFAIEQGLHWIEDESNARIMHARNFIRHEILSVLKTRWPSVSESLSRSAKHNADAHDLLMELGEEALARVVGTKPNTLSVNALLKEKESAQRWLIRAWIDRANYPAPSAAKLQTIINNVLSADIDRNPLVRWQDTELRRYRDDLYLMNASSLHDLSAVYEWNGLTPFSIPEIGILTASSPIQPMTIRFRQGGEIMDWAGRGKLNLKNLFQEWGVPPWERRRSPLLFVQEKLVGVVLKSRSCIMGNVKGIKFVDASEPKQSNQ